MITIDELKSLISKVGGDMSEADAKTRIHAADTDGNMGIDFSIWEALHGEEEVDVLRNIFNNQSISSLRQK